MPESAGNVEYDATTANLGVAEYQKRPQLVLSDLRSNYLVEQIYLSYSRKSLVMIVDVVDLTVTVVAECDQIAIGILPRLSTADIPLVMDVKWQVISVAYSTTP
jgi:hypothetical protein